MVVDTGTAILILGVFVLPGFITLILRERLYVVRGEEDPFERLLLALLYSAVIYGVLLVAAHRLGLQKVDLIEFHKGEKPLDDDLIAASVVLLLLPGLIAIVGSRWMASKRLRPWTLRLVGSSEAHSTTSAWNQFFSKQGSCLIRATLTDGRVVGGLYDETGLAGYSEEVPDLYLRQRWEFDEDDWFIGPADRSLGIWLPQEGVSSLEFYEVELGINMLREIPKISE
jgi:Family of unknown function (DUF6338)